MSKEYYDKINKLEEQMKEINFFKGKIKWKKHMS